MRRLAGLDAVGLARRGRHFIVASTGGGKSTLAEALLEHYQFRFPDDWLYFIDPKRRFVPVEYGEDSTHTELFPHGWKAMRYGRREGVAIAGRVIKHGTEPEYKPSEALIMQDDATVYEVLDWLYDHANVQTPSMVYADESFEMVRGYRADHRLRRLIQQGRELGVGTVIINQRPRWIDATFLSESEALYIGPLYDPRDREAILPHIQGTPLRRYVAEPGLLPRRRWLYVDRLRWERSRVFELNIGGKTR